MWHQALNSVGVYNSVKPRITCTSKESFWRTYNLSWAIVSRFWISRRVGNLEKQVVWAKKEKLLGDFGAGEKVETGYPFL